ncbi:MAG TPA: pullulanase-type alpha-1,6-glucosidase [Caldilineaceae bacterium]|nr:pullulanase-type alpha-1,6-glucosidase [Caldilineaceae bacterium]
MNQSIASHATSNHPATGQHLQITADAQPRSAVIHYHRPDDDYGDMSSKHFRDYWGLHVWQGAQQPTTWEQPLKPTGKDDFGIFFQVPLAADATELAYILHRGERKDPGPDQALSLADDNNGVYEVWLVADPHADQPLHYHRSNTPRTGLDLQRQCAHWLTASTIVWDVEHQPGMRYQLHYASEGNLHVDQGQLNGGKSIELHHDAAGLDEQLRAKFPHLTRYHVFTLNALTVAPLNQAQLDKLLQSQLVVSAELDGLVIHATGLQLPGVLDDRYTYDGALGALVDEEGVTIRLWAPTAQQVVLFLFDEAVGSRCHHYPLQRSEQGTWEVRGDRSWIGRYYLYEVTVYVPQTGKIEHNLVTDPYALGLSMNSKRTLIVDLEDPALQPPGWQSHTRPPLDAFEDIVLYELHLRDFSINDQSVPPALRGKYGAFTVANSNGMHHLRELTAAGLTHLHLLPVFDFVSVNEDPLARQEPLIQRDAAFDSDAQAEAVRAVRDMDGFNWGYDPYHFTVPEGSYATDANGTARIVEFRAMVQALHAMGLRLIMDVVYNHTHDGGIGPHSVLDKIVPGYYHRLNADGAIERSTCCANTAMEHHMMEKLMLDSLRTWVTHYGLDGFRFDLMGHHMKRNMVKARAMLDELDPSLYIYGEGWDFGEVMHNARGVNATQFNLAGTGIGTFNDRLRNAVRGGRPFDSGTALIANQGFTNGLWYAHNAESWGNEWERTLLLQAADWIRVGLAGNLADYAFEAADGYRKRGGEIDYYGEPTGYNEEPHENVVYVEAHDNQTLYDNNIYKLPRDTSMADRVRVQTLGLALTLLAQGVPFLHAGSEMLRSKSLERDSYNSGDWFNRLFFNYSSNNFGAGLPVEAGFEADLMRPLLADPALRPDKAAIRQCVENVKALLTIRKSSPLFRLRTKEAVIARLAFHNTGPNQVPGMIVMSLSDQVDGLPSIDPHYDFIIVVFNATTHTQQFQKLDWQGCGLTLHPAHQASSDAVLLTASVNDEAGMVTVPARTVAVFVAKANSSIE